MKSSPSSVLTAAMIAAMSAGMTFPSLRTAGSGNNHRPTPPRMDTALQREIAAHNAAVDRRKAEKRARKKAA